MAAPPPYATASQYLAAFNGLKERGISSNYLRFLRAHLDVAAQPITWRRLGMTMGLPERTAFTTVNLQYGTFAKLLANELPPSNPPFWLHLIADWAGNDERGEQQFVMRPEVVAALASFAWPDASDDAKGTPPPPDGPAVDLSQPPERIETTVSRIVRDTALVRDLKQLHKHRCQRCGKRLRLRRGTYYSEGHHLRPLGKPHRGPDVRANILVLCPDCHVLLDFLAVPLDPKRLRKHRAHDLDTGYVEYHNQLVRRRDGA